MEPPHWMLRVTRKCFACNLPQAASMLFCNICVSGHVPSLYSALMNQAHRHCMHTL